YAVAVKGSAGPSSQAPFVVDLFPATAEKEPNNSLGTAQPISLPTTIIGALDQAGEIDYFRFIATPGQAVGVQALVQGTGSKLDPVLQVTDATGRVLAEGTNGLLGFVGPTAGAYGLTIRDREYRGGKEFRYRL